MPSHRLEPAARPRPLISGRAERRVQRLDRRVQPLDQRFDRLDRLDRRQSRPERSTLRTIRSSQRAFAMLAVPIAVAMSLSYVVPNAQAVEPSLVEIPAQLQTLTAVTVQADAAGEPVIRDSYDVTAAPPPIVWPVSKDSRRSDGFGARGGSHEGADINPPGGTPIVAMAAGVVIETNAPGYSSLGTHVRIQHLIDGQVVVSVYGHMVAGSMPFKVGDTVAAGQFIGNVGCTGHCTGNHLHLEIRLGGTRAVDPIAWLNAHAR